MLRSKNFIVSALDIILILQNTMIFFYNTKWTPLDLRLKEASAKRYAKQKTEKGRDVGISEKKSLCYDRQKDVSLLSAIYNTEMIKLERRNETLTIPNLTRCCDACLSFQHSGG